ncbi:EamA-like transporter family-domain-containing protein [Infundibulicybe gibba]|nr:EamA-like transporter family-domain-containing protein [Infundibulicybe gibba]
MPTGNTYVALPLNSPTSVDYPPASLPTRSQSPGVTITKTKWRSTFPRTREIIESNTGLLLVVASQAFFSLVNMAVKRLHFIDPPVSTMQLIAIRMSVTYVCSLIYMLSTGIPDPFLGPKGVRILLVLRGVSGFIGVFGMYYSLQYLSLSDATVLTFLAPLCTAIAGSLLLNEKFSIREALAGIFSLFGVILIARPAIIFGANSQGRTVTGDITNTVVERDTPSQRLAAVGIALVGVLGGTGVYISIRAVGKRAHPLHILASYSMQCITVTTIYMIATKSPFIVPTRLDWLGLFILIGISGFAAQILFTMGMQRETASRGALAAYTQVIFAGILEQIFFKPIPSILSVCGTLIILTSALYVILTKKKDSNTVAMFNQLDEQELEEGLLGDSLNVEPGESLLEDKRPAVRSSIELHNIHA